MFNLTQAELERLKSADHVVVKEPDLVQHAVRALLRDTNCPVDAIPTLLSLVDRPTGFDIEYTTATKRKPDYTLRRRYAKPNPKQVRLINT
jgi:hypothetical protein